MAANATANLIVRLRDKVSGPAKGIRSAFGRISKDFGQLRKGFDLAGHIGMAAGAAQQFGSQARGALDSVLRPALSFEDTMAKVGALTRGVTEQELQDLTDLARQLGRDTRFMAIESAQGFEQLAIAGFNAKQQMVALPSILKLTQASGAELGRVADISSDLMGSFGKRAQDVGHINGVLAATFSNSTTTLETLFETFKMAAPIATKAGISMEQTAILAGVLGNAGLKGSIGGTALRGVLIGLAARTPKANKALRSLGLNAKTIEKNFKNPANLIKLIADGLERKGITQGPKQLDILNKIFGRRQAAGAAVLIDGINKVQDNGKTAFENLSGGVYEAEEALDRIAKVMDSTGLASVRKLGSAVESLKLDIAQEWGPAFKPLITELTGVTNKVAEWGRANPELVGQLGKVLIGVVGISTVLAPILLSLSSAVSLVTVLWGGFKLLKTPIRESFYLLKSSWQWIKKIDTATGRLTGTYRDVATSSRSGGVILEKNLATTRAWALAAQGVTRALTALAVGMAAYEITKAINEGLGKILGTKSGTVTGDIGLAAGEDIAFNKRLKSIGDTLGIKALSEAAQGNIEATKTEEAGMTPAQLARRRYLQNESVNLFGANKPEEVRGKITLEINDKRTQVKKIEKQRGPDLEVGYSSLGF